MELNYWMGPGIGLIILFWPVIFTYKMKRKSQAELEIISLKFNQINKSYLAHGIRGAVVFLPVLLALLLMFFKFDQPGGTRIMTVFSWVVFSLAGIFFGSFAAKWGVYPASKYFGPRTKYIYGHGGRISKLGQIQILSSVIAGILALVFTLVMIFQLPA